MTAVIGIDHQNATFPIAQLDAVRGFVSEILGPAEDRDRGLHTYRRSVKWELGAILAWSPERPEFLLSLNGDSAGIVFQHGKAFERFMRLYELGARLTRIDPKADLPREFLKLDDVHAAAVAGQVHGFKRYDPRRPVVMRDENGESVLRGDTAYFGSRGKEGGGRYLRIYDKFLESRGLIDATRFELEATGETARVYQMVLASSRDEADFWQKVGHILGGCVDFVDKAGAHGHYDRMKRLGWWTRVLERIGRAEFKVPRPEVPLQRAMMYLKESWATNVAMVHCIAESQGLDGDDFIRRFFQQMVEIGAPRVYHKPGRKFMGVDLNALVENQELHEYLPV